MKKILPSILAADFLNLEQDIQRLEKTDAQWLHVDVMDGHFVEQITFGLNLIKEIKKHTTKKLDIHLMVSNPDFLIQELLEVGVDNITIHSEILNTFNYKNYLDKFKEKDTKFGLAFNPDTDPKKFENVIKEFDLLLVMSVFPGLGGQKFMSEVIPKIKYLHSIKKNDSIIEIDGGINDTTILQLKTEPLDLIVSGSFLFSGDIQKNIDKLR